MEFIYQPHSIHNTWTHFPVYYPNDKKDFRYVYEIREVGCFDLIAPLKNKQGFERVGKFKSFDDAKKFSEEHFKQNFSNHN